MWRGVRVIALSSDTQERALQMADKVKASGVQFGFGLSLASARAFAPAPGHRAPAVLRPGFPYPYPPVLLTAGLNDSRVAYWEAAKFAARLRDAGLR